MNGSSVLLGHERAREFLFGALAEKRVAQAYLFTGPAQIGKRLMALTFARGILCPGGSKVPCEECPSCRKASRGVHPDLLLVEPQTDPGRDAKSLKIEQVRDLQRALSLKAHEGTRKVAILDDAEFLTEQAGNALLKVIEEPPPWAVLSRGRVGWALDMDMALREKFLSLAFLLLTPGPAPGNAGLQSLLQNFGKERRTFEEFLRLFLLLSRDLMVLQSGAREEQVVNRDKIPEMKQINLQTPPAALGRIATMVSETLGQLRANASPQLALEALAARISLARAGVKESHHV
ncbi:MAG: hypothetical protein HYY65_03660 [Candidatus Tectomicrobia bacterium]|uniref:DNA polymerase III subunit delta' n=1 Tax=Tectimicrobiota bacterium TaxID=2528274 RepID=A0A932GN22_UNCTE|nr:hypothetical protein [Candidatus Tectomicrobia bacterium]